MRSLDDRAYELAAEILAEGSKVSQERMGQHGGIVTEYTRLAAHWSILLGVKITPEMAVVMEAILKANRIACGARDHRDHYLDGSNYFALAWGVRRALNPEKESDEETPSPERRRVYSSAEFNGA